jgi:hypothetical protein
MLFQPSKGKRGAGLISFAEVSQTAGIMQSGLPDGNFLNQKSQFVQTFAGLVKDDNSWS